MDELDSSAQTFLLLGGDSSLAQAFSDLARRKGYSVSVTSRRRATDISAGVFNLDISSRNSIEEFLIELSKTEVSAIFCFLGAPFKEPTSFGEYVSVHLVNTFYLLEQMVARFEQLRTKSLVYVSSRAARHPSRDAPYAIVKGGLTAGVQALSKHAPAECTLVSVVPGLVLGSAMSNDMGALLTGEHERRSAGNLLTLESFASNLLDVFESLEAEHNGSVIPLGPQYT